MTTIKICFNTEIHRTQNLPANLQDFIKHTESLFLSSLPENWLLHYIDNDGDKIMITDQKDYDEFKDLNHSSTTVTKVYIVQTKTFGVNKFKPEEEIAIMEEVAAKTEIQPDELIQVEEEKVEKVSSPRVEESGRDLWEQKKEEESDTVITPGAENKQFCVDADVLDELMSTMVDNSILEEKKDEENIAEKLKKSSESEVIHYGIACNGCGQNPILGARFKCTICPSFSYCENCERANEHPHNLLKMKHRDIHDVFQPVPAQPVVEKVKNVDDSFNARMNKRLKKLITFIKGGDKGEANSENDKTDKKGKIDKKERAYYDTLMKKVKAMKKKFPKADIDVLCAYVNGAPDDMNVDELIANYRI